MSNRTITRKGDLSIFNRDPPSCFSNRVARVRRCNSLEDRRLQDQLRSIHLEHVIRNRNIFKEQQTLVKQLNGIQTVRETPQIGLERRRLQQVSPVYPNLAQRSGNSTKLVHERANSAQPPSVRSHSPSLATQCSAVTPFPSPDCRCSYTGHRMRRSHTLTTSPHETFKRSATVPLFTSFVELRENSGPSSMHLTDFKEDHDELANPLAARTHIGLKSCRLPIIGNK